MMTIRGMEIIEHRIPFRFSFKHALAERSEGHGILLRVEDGRGLEGYGECVPRSYVTGETPETVTAALREDYVPAWLGRAFASFDEVTAAIGEAVDGLPRERHAAFCALELALLDLAGRAFGRSAGDVVGPPVVGELFYSGVISAQGVDAALKACEAIRELGLAEVKFKVGLDPRADRAILEGARRILGEGCRIRIDANAAWTAEEALRRLESFLDLGLESVEQPLAAGDIEGLAWLTPRSPVPVIADESLASVEDARRLIERGACHHFNIRISKCGGLVSATRIRELGRAHGIGFQLGAQVGETAVLSAAGRLFGARSPGLLFCEGSYGAILLEEDIGREDLTIGKRGRAPALRGPGLGVLVDAGRLAPFVQGRILLR